MSDASGNAGTQLPTEWLGHLATDRLHLILLPTERCNFRCVYCYENFEHGRMSPETLAGVKALISRRSPELASLALDWFGGEPLLALDLIEDVQRHALAQAASTPFRLSGSMTTNGYLLEPETLAKLVALGVTRYQISADGGASTHDERRPLASGGPTFESVWRNITAARSVDLGFEMIVRIHLDGDNFGGVLSLLEQCREELGADERYRIFLRPVARLGSPNDGRWPILDDHRSRQLTAAARAAARGLGLHLYDPERESAGVCYASAANSLVIRSTGDVAKCTVALRHPRNRLGRLKADGRVRLDNRLLNGWLRGLLGGDRDVAACPMRGFADTVQTGGGLKVVS